MTSNCWYSKWLSQKMTPVCEGMFQIWPIGMKLWDKTFNFEDKIELLVLKMIVSKRMTAVCKGMFQIWPIGMELWDKTFNFEDNIRIVGTQNDCLNKNDPFLWSNVSNLTMFEWSYGAKHSSFEDNISLSKFGIYHHQYSTDIGSGARYQAILRLLVPPPYQKRKRIYLNFLCDHKLILKSLNETKDSEKFHLKNMH